MKGFTLIKYSGDDAGEVLCTILANGAGNAPEVHEIATRTQIGFRPNDETEEDDDEQEDD